MSLNPKQKDFIKNFLNQSSVTFGNAVLSYSKAYNTNVGTHAKYLSSKSAASRLLSNIEVSKEINDQLKNDRLTKEFLLSQLFLLCSQWNDLSIKVKALSIAARVLSFENDSKSGNTLNIQLGTDPDPLYIKWRKETLQIKDNHAI